MGNFERTKDKQAFNGLAETYDALRPTYPDAVFREIIAFWRGSAPPNIADVGCGTGISSRAFYQFLAGKCDIVGIEPGADMLGTARGQTRDPIRFLDGEAEALPIQDGSLDIISAAQAIQWFDRAKFYAEADRVLAPGGVIAIYENNRDWQGSPLLDAHENFLEKFSWDDGLDVRYSRYYRDYPYSAELDHYFGNAIELEFRWSRQMTVEDFYAMAKTSTQFMRAVRNIGEPEAWHHFVSYTTPHVDSQGYIDIAFVTRLYSARKSLPEIVHGSSE